MQDWTRRDVVKTGLAASLGALVLRPGRADAAPAGDAAEGAAAPAAPSHGHGDSSEKKK